MILKHGILIRNKINCNPHKKKTIILILVIILLMKNKFIQYFKLKNYHLIDIVNPIRKEMGIKIKMKGSYFLKDENVLSEIRKRHRLQSLSLL